MPRARTIVSPATAPSQASPPPASRSSWSGQLAIGNLTVPVKAYPAVVIRSQGLLHQVHGECGTQIQQRKCCPQHGEIPTDQIAKAYSYGPDDDIVLSADELGGLQPSDQQTLQVEHLLPRAELDLSLLSGRSLFLIPANPPACTSYALILHTLSRRNVWAIGRGAISEQRQLLAVQATSHRLVVHVLHWPAQQRSCPLFAPLPANVSDVDLHSLEGSLPSLRQPVPWIDFVDEYELKLTALVANKVAARSKVKSSPAVAPSLASSPASVSRSRRSRRAA